MKRSLVYSAPGATYAAAGMLKRAREVVDGAKRNLQRQDDERASLEQSWREFDHVLSEEKKRDERKQLETTGGVKRDEYAIERRARTLKLIYERVVRLQTPGSGYDYKTGLQTEPLEAMQRLKGMERHVFSPLTDRMGKEQPCSTETCTMDSYKRGERYYSYETTRWHIASGEVYICKAHGRWHLCNESQCDSLITAARSENVTCRITGISYAVPYANGIYDGSVSADSLRRSRVIPAGMREGAPAPAPYQSAPLSSSAANPAQIAELPTQPVPAKKPRAAADDGSVVIPYREPWERPSASEDAPMLLLEHDDGASKRLLLPPRSTSRQPVLAITHVPSPQDALQQRLPCPIPGTLLHGVFHEDPKQNLSVFKPGGAPAAAKNGKISKKRAGPADWERRRLQHVAYLWEHADSLRDEMLKNDMGDVSALDSHFGCKVLSREHMYQECASRCSRILFDNTIRQSYFRKLQDAERKADADAEAYYDKCLAKGKQRDPIKLMSFYCHHMMDIMERLERLGVQQVTRDEHKLAYFVECICKVWFIIHATPAARTEVDPLAKRVYGILYLLQEGYTPLVRLRKRDRMVLPPRAATAAAAPLPSAASLEPPKMLFQARHGARAAPATRVVKSAAAAEPDDGECEEMRLQFIPKHQWLSNIPTPSEVVKYHVAGQGGGAAVAIVECMKRLKSCYESLLAEPHPLEFYAPFLLGNHIVLHGI